MRRASSVCERSASPRGAHRERAARGAGSRPGIDPRLRAAAAHRDVSTASRASVISCHAALPIRVAILGDRLSLLSADHTRPAEASARGGGRTPAFDVEARFRCAFAARPATEAKCTHLLFDVRVQDSLPMRRPLAGSAPLIALRARSVLVVRSRSVAPAEAQNARSLEQPVGFTGGWTRISPGRAADPPRKQARASLALPLFSPDEYARASNGLRGSCPSRFAFRSVSS